MSTGKKREIDFTSGKALPKIIRFALPLMATGILQILFNTVDSMVVGNFAAEGEKALAGISATTTLNNLIINFFVGFSVGVNVLVAQFFGAKREKDLSELIHTAVLLSLAFGAFVALFGALLARNLLILTNAPASALEYATTYLRIIFIGAPVTLLYNFGAAIMRAVGDTRRPMNALIAACVANIGLDLLFVKVFSMDVAGAAIATVISQGLAAALVVIGLFRDKGCIRLEWKKLKFYPKKLGMIVRIGLPAGIQPAVFSVANVVIQSAVNSFGQTAVVAGVGAGYQIEVIIYNALMAFYHAALNFTGQNVGAQKLGRVRKGILLNVACISVFTVVTSVGSVIFGRQLLGLFTDSEEAIEYGMKRLLCINAPYLLVALMEISAASVRGLGASVTPTLVSFFGGCVFRILWVYLVFPHYHTVEALFINYPITWIIVTIGHVISFFIFYGRMRRRPGVSEEAS